MWASPVSQFSSRYTSTADVKFDIHNIFDDAVHAFSTELSSDPAKLAWITDSKHGNMQDVLNAVTDAQAKYNEKRDKESSKARDALLRFSEKVNFYSGVMDVLVQHHPEYTALAWGGMKFLFLGVVNHRKIVTRLSEGLAQIADLLPKAGLVLQLYPIPQMRQIVVNIYAHIVKFLLRALRWYQESRIMHVVHSITRPTELRYDDILAQISSLSRTLADTACMSGYTEQRDMHLGIREQIEGQKTLQLSMDQVMTLVREIRDSMLTEYGLSQAARIDTRQRLSDIQLHQFQSHIAVSAAVSGLPDPSKALQTAQHLADRRQAKPSPRGPAFWFQSKVQRWNQSRESSFIVITSTRKSRFFIQDFCARSIYLLHEDDIPVLWALRAVDFAEAESHEVSMVDLIKYLVTQALALDEQTRTDAALTDHLGSCSRASTEKEWINVLASIIGKLRLLYIIIDVETMSYTDSETMSRPLPTIFENLFYELSARGSATVVRVALMGYGTPLLRGPFNGSMESCCVAIGRGRQTKGTLAKRSRGGKGFAAKGPQKDSLKLESIATVRSRPRRQTDHDTVE